MVSKKIIGFLTDFGLLDPYVGICKGVIAQISPETSVIDITHGITPQDIRQGAFYLASAVPYFPQGSIFLAVVDPGVGTSRACILLEYGENLFVGPDNGIFSWVVKNPLTQLKPSCNQTEQGAHWDQGRTKAQNSMPASAPKYYKIVPEALFDILGNFGLPISSPSTTFHGRDIFAPAAALLSVGITPESFSRPYSNALELPFPFPGIHDDHITGTILFFDHFGNGITNIPRNIVTELCEKRRCNLQDLVVSIKGKAEAIPLVTTYCDVSKGQPLALFGSFNLMEISVNQGNGQEVLGLQPDDQLELHIA